MKSVKKMVVALVLMTVFSGMLGLSGCSFQFASTENEMYATLLDAEKDLLMESKTLTCNMSIKSSVKNGSATITTESDITYSVQPSKNEMFITMDTSLMNGSKIVESEMDIKVGKIDSRYYIYTKTPISQTVMDRTFYSISKDYAQSLMSFAAISEFIDFDIEEIFKEYEYDYIEIKNSYDSVFSEQLAERKKEDQNAQALSEMSIKKNGREFCFKQKMLLETLDSSMKNRVHVETEEEIVGKKDEIKKAYLKNDIFLKSNYGGHISKYETTEIDINFSYDFDENGYKAINTDGLSLTSGKSEQVGMATITLNIGELKSEHYIDASLKTNESNFLNITKGFRGEGYKVEWFNDNKYQNPFKPNELSRKEFKETENLYGNLSVENRYAVCAIDYEINDIRDEAYKMVFGKKVAHYNGEENIYSIKIAEDSTYKFLTYDEYIDEIYVDGIKQASEDIVLKNQQVYYVKYIENIDNSADNIFDIKDYFA